MMPSEVTCMSHSLSSLKRGCIQDYTGGCQGSIGVILGDNGKENGNYYNGLYRDYRVYGWLSKLWSRFWVP